MQGANSTADEFRPDWSEGSYWLDGLAPAANTSGALPKSVDVLIVGSGYTGLNAAIETSF